MIVRLDDQREMIWTPAFGFKRTRGAHFLLRSGSPSHYGKGLGVRLPAFTTYAGNSLRRARSKRVGHPVMWSQAIFRNVVPPFARWQVIAALRMERIVDAIVAL